MKNKINNDKLNYFINKKKNEKTLQRTNDYNE
jgi:hypothetical protein